MVPVRFVFAAVTASTAILASVLWAARFVLVQMIAHDLLLFLVCTSHSMMHCLFVGSL